MIKLVPETVVGYDELDQPVFTITSYDDQVATVTLHDNLVSKHSWPEIATAVQRALEQLYPDET